MAMQQCRAVNRDKEYVFGRPEFLPHFALYTPLAWLSKLTKPPAGKEYEWVDKFTNAWSGVSVSMSTLAKKLVLSADVLNIDDLGLMMDFSSVGSCTAKDYGAIGCMMSMDTSKLGLKNANTKMVLPFLCLNLAMHAYIQTCMHAHIHAEKHTHMNACTCVHTHTTSR